MSIEGADEIFTASKADCIIHLHITLIKGTGNLEIEVLNFPPILQVIR
jgi:hypothetical protein